jgi:predicted Zn-dependent peptidase
MLETTTPEEIEQIKAMLSSYAVSLASYIQSQEWTQLDEVLDERQHYLETLLADTTTITCPALKAVMHDLLQEDAEMMAEVLHEKSKVEYESLALTHSRKLIKAYDEKHEDAYAW